MATELQKLMFTIDLLDRVSGPAGKIQKTLGNVADSAQANFGKIAAGGAGVTAAGMALQGLTAPAQEFNLAVGEVRSLDVDQGALDILADKAVGYSIKYGEFAKDFVSSSYDIQSAIGGLEGADLATFTNASAVLAKGTKADTATITDYMGTMYGIFEKTANDMGKSAWVEQLAGQTATAVQMYKTTGAEMAGAFTSLGAKATSAGREAAEQIAVLGKLQATMSGSEAGTKYKAFLSGIGGAQKELGLSFTDSNGRMLGMADILQKIKGKFGETLDVAESGALKKAFGSDEAVALIDLLMPKVDSLAGDIEKLGQVQGMEKATQMAGSMVDPFQQWSQGVQAVRIGLGQALLPTIIPVVEELAEGAGAVYRFTKQFPTLTKWIGYGIVVITGITAAMATFAILGGVAQMALMGYSNTAKLAALMTRFLGKESKIAKIAMIAWNLGVSLLSGTLSVFRFIMLAANAAMLANPALAIAFGIGLLIGIVATLIYKWESLKAAFLDTSWGKAIFGIFDRLMSGFRKIGALWDWIKSKFSWLPGIGGEDETVTSEALEEPKRSMVPRGGVGKTIANQISNNSNTSNQSSMQIGTVVTNRPINAQEINAMMAMGV